MSLPTGPAPGGLRQLASHGVAYVVGTALQGLGVLAVTPFITRSLSPGAYGRVSTALVVIQLVGAVAAAGLPQVILREHHRPGGGPRAARALAGAMLVVAVGVCLLVGAAVALVAATAGGLDVRLPLTVGLGAAALTGVVAGQSLMRAQRRPGRFLAMAVLSTVVAQLGGLLAARVSPTPEAFLSAYVAILLLTAVLSAAVTRPLWPGREPQAVRRGVGLAVPLIPHGVAMLVLLMGDVVVVSALLGSEAVATYQVSLLLGNIPFVLTTALTNAWAPAVLGHPAQQRWSWAAGTGALLAAVVAVAAGVLSLLSPWLGAVAAPASFDLPTIVLLVALMSSVGPAYLLYHGSSLALIDAAATGRLAWAAVACAAALLGLAAVGAAWAGVTGVAAARLLCYLLLSLACAVLARRRGLRWGLRPVAAVAALTAVVALGAGGLLPVHGEGSLLRPALVGVLLVAAAVAAGVAVRRWRGGPRVWDPRRRSTPPT